MSENNPNVDFDDISKIAPTKRQMESASNETTKKPKITLPKNVVKRKFPGPAGLLPDHRDFNLALLNSPKPQNEEMPCSQMSVSVFHNSPWVEMSRDYHKLLEKFNIKWIKTSASFNKLHNQKAPFLGAIIQNIECLDGKNPVVNVVLKDATGEIQGTIIHNLYEEYSSSLVVGSVIVLKQFGVLTTGSNNNHYLTITMKNLVTIYAKSDEDSDVKVIKVQDVSCEDLQIGTESRNVFDDGFVIPDEFESRVLKENQIMEKKFNFKNVQSCVKKIKETEEFPPNGSIFEDNIIPDNLDCLLETEPKKNFSFKKKTITISCSQVSVCTSEEDSKIWENALEGVDADSFFEDF